MLRWRERVETAKVAGSFTQADRYDAANGTACLIAEAASVLGSTYHDVHEFFHLVVPGYYPNDAHAVAVGGAWMYVVIDNDFRRADMLLDAVEDRLLQLKRDMVC